MESERIPLQRAVAVIQDGSIAIWPARSQLIGAAIELGLALLAIGTIVLLFSVLPLFALMALLMFAVLFGPIGVLGLVYGAFGTSFVMERKEQSARWQQGFLGMGIGTTDFCPFSRIGRFEVVTDEKQALPSGERQDVVQWEVRLIKDNDRDLTVGTVVAARPVADIGVERANRLASALAEMAGVEARLAAVAPAAEGPADMAPAPRRRYRRVSAARNDGER